MNKFEEIKNKNIDDFSDRLNKISQVDSAPWAIWFCDKYCNNCEPVDLSEIAGHFTEEAYCERYNKCRFFNNILDNNEIAKLWLLSEVDKDVKN